MKITPSVVRQQLDKWEYTCQVLLKYWNSMLRGFVPFKLARENPDELREKGHLPDGEAFAYMMKIIEVLDRQGNGMNLSAYDVYSTTNCF